MYTYEICKALSKIQSTDSVNIYIYHKCGIIWGGYIALPPSQHQHCTDEAQKAETVLSAVSCIYIYIYSR